MYFEVSTAKLKLVIYTQDFNNLKLLYICAVSIALLNQMSLCEKREEEVKEEDVYTRKTTSPEPSCVSMKSDASMINPLYLSAGTVTSDPEWDYMWFNF